MSLSLRRYRAVIAAAALVAGTAGAAGTASAPGAGGKVPASTPARGHGEQARRFEDQGRLVEAVREYQAAYDQDATPELLYRLGICRRKLGEFALAKAAMRGYLHAAPEGPLRESAERQLMQLEVLLEDARLRRTEPGLESKAAPGLSTSTAPARKPRQSQRKASANGTAPTVTANGTAKAAEVPPLALQNAPATANLPRGPNSSPSIERAPATALATPIEQPAPGAIRKADSTQSMHAALPAAPRAALAPAARRSTAQAAAPWIAIGAGVLAAGGAALWWDGGRVSNDLDARFASGDLTAVDRPRYARAHRESVAGRVLVSAALLAGSAAVVLWW